MNNERVDPGARMGKKNPDPVCTSQIIFPRAKKQFWGYKYLNSFMRIRILLTLDPGIGIEKIGISSNTARNVIRI
jgi:hypothetical protein